MSGKTSFIIVGIVLTILVICVYHYSTPNGPVHLAPMLSTDEPATAAQSVKDTTTKTADTIASR